MSAISGVGKVDEPCSNLFSQHGQPSSLSAPSPACRSVTIPLPSSSSFPSFSGRPLHPFPRPCTPHLYPSLSLIVSMSSHPDPPDPTSRITQLQHLNPPPHRPPASYRPSIPAPPSDTSSSSDRSKPFVYTDQLASPGGPPSDSSDTGTRSSGRHDSASSGERMMFSPDYTDTQPQPRQSFEPVEEDVDAVPMQPVFSNATDISDLSSVPITPALSQFLTSLPPSRQPTLPPSDEYQQGQKQKIQLPTTRSAPQNIPRFPHPRVRSQANAFAIEDFEPLKPEPIDTTPPVRPSRDGTASENLDAQPDGVDIEELWIDPFVLRSLTGRRCLVDRPLPQMDREVVSAWINERLDHVGVVGKRWKEKLPSISLDPDERQAPLARAKNGVVNLHVALHRVTGLDTGWDGAPVSRYSHPRPPVGRC